MPVVELGTSSNPLAFADLTAGTTTTHPDSPIALWNDKGGVLKSKDAKNVAIQVVEMLIEDEILGTSDGSSSQSFTTAFFPIIDLDADNPIIVEVAGIAWTRVFSFTGQSPTAEVYTINIDTGVVQFGSGAEGKVPPLGDQIKISYTPNDLLHGAELVNRRYFAVRSTGVIANTITQSNESETSTDATHVTVLHTGITSVTKVVLASDPNGSDFFPGGSFDPVTGIITLGFSLPLANSEVLVTYTYSIADDAETDFTFLGKGETHQFAAPIPSNNAKLLFFQVSLLDNASPTNGMKVKFRLKFLFEG